MSLIKYGLVTNTAMKTKWIEGQTLGFGIVTTRR